MFLACELKAFQKDDSTVLGNVKVMKDVSLISNLDLSQID